MATKRMHYYDGEFLKQDDFTTEQSYHLGMRRLHNQYLHTPGVVYGLEVTAGDNMVTISPGVAVDADGHELILDAPLPVPVASAGDIAIKYKEEETDSSGETGITGNKRVTESTVIAAPADTPRIVLARALAAGSPVPLDSAFAPQRSGPRVDGSLLVGKDLTVAGKLTVQGGEEVISNKITRGNVQLGDDDADTVTVEGKLVTGHSSGRLKIGSPVDISGNMTLTGPVTLPADPALPLQAATRQYVDNRSVAKTGDTMTGVLNLPADGLKVGVTQLVAAGGHVGIGVAAPENSEGWNRVVDLLGAGHARYAVRTAVIDGRVVSHESGWWGSPPGMVLGTKTAHAVSIGTNSATRVTIDPAGRVGIGKTNPAVALDVSGQINSTSLATGSVASSGAITSPMFNVFEVFESRSGPLPFTSSTFTTSGGTLLVFASGTGFSTVGGTIGMSVRVDGVEQGQAKSFTNELSSHKAFSALALVVGGIAAGSHTVTLAPLPGTATDGNDVFNVTILELPWATSFILGTVLTGGLGTITKIGP
jgi:hypothetical protein